VPLYEVIHASQNAKTQAPLVSKCVSILRSKVCQAKQVRGEGVGGGNHLNGCEGEGWRWVRG